MIPGLWQIVFGLGVFASCRFLPGAIVVVGVWYVASGLACLAWAQGPLAFSAWTMGAAGLASASCWSRRSCGGTRDSPMDENKAEAPFAYEGLDRVIHERARLGVLTSLIGHPKGLVFGDLRRLCGLTDGNLSRHLHVLQEAGLVEGLQGFRTESAPDGGAGSPPRDAPAISTT